MFKTKRCNDARDDDDKYILMLDYRPHSFVVTRFPTAIQVFLVNCNLRRRRREAIDRWPLCAVSTGRDCIVNDDQLSPWPTADRLILGRQSTLISRPCTSAIYEFF